MASHDYRVGGGSPVTRKPLRTQSGGFGSPGSPPMTSPPLTSPPLTSPSLSILSEKYDRYGASEPPTPSRIPLLGSTIPPRDSKAPFISSAPISYNRTDTISSHHRTAGITNINGISLPTYPARAALSMLIPFVLVLYYYLTYWRWLRFPEGSPQTWIKRGYLDNVEFVNYSWFVIATFALNLGTYCIAGTVSAMVMRKEGNPRNLKRLIILAANTFQDPAGWINTFIKLVKKRRSYKSNGRLWNSLAFFSIIGFAAWPLTGLTMQTMSGFTIEETYLGRTAWVVGRNFSSFNGRDGALMTERTTEFWSLGFSPSLPLRQQIYVPEGSELEVNVTESNTMPDDASEGIFLAPQATGPIVGEAFGLFVRYNCSIVNSVSEFSVLNRRNETLSFRGLAPDTGLQGYGYLLDDQSVIFLRNKTTGLNPLSTIGNVNASLELGTSISFDNITDLSDGERIGYASTERGYPGLDEPVFLEAALWQNIKPTQGGQGSIPEGFVFQDVENDIEDLRNSALYPGQKAVGVRCQASSAIGTALIDGLTGIFSNFTQLNAKPREGGGIKRFESGIPHMILQSPTIPPSLRLSDKIDWFGALYASIERSSLTTNRFGDFLAAAPGVLQAQDLKRALLRAHKTHAVHIMYDGLSDPSYTWPLVNMKIGQEAEILTRGAVPPEAVLAMLTIWALCIVALAGVYQFRKRWTETLDGYTIFRFGVDRPDDILPEQLTADFDTSAVIETLPGMLGDLEPTRDVGYIGLVKSGEADWNKKYG